MSDLYVATRWGYVACDPDDAPTADEAFADCLSEIWENASSAERIAISHERHELGIRNKRCREYTATEQMIVDAIHAGLMEEIYREQEWIAEQAKLQDRGWATIDEEFGTDSWDDDSEAVSRHDLIDMDDDIPF